MSRSRLATLANATLGFTIFVILWGAFVRASGSGAGCGSHWPTCNGEVIPRAPSTATVIEFTHRVTSGISLLLVVAQAWASRRATPPGHLARRASGLALFFMLTEALVGAGLVVFEKVAGDKSLARGWWMTAHLINTFLLLASMTIATWAAHHDRAPRAAREHTLPLGAAYASVLLTGVTGAIAALGDTLFPAKSFAEGLALELSGQAHLFVQLRVLHPFVAVGTTLLVGLVASRYARSGTVEVARMGRLVGAGIFGQATLGVVNLLLAAPTWMQLVHLFAADLVWMGLVVLGAEALASTASAPSETH